MPRGDAMEEPVAPRAAASAARTAGAARAAAGAEAAALRAAADGCAAAAARCAALPRGSGAAARAVMAPFGPLAFLPATLVHTNELLVHLGDGLYVERTGAQAAAVLTRREKALREAVRAAEAGARDLGAQLDAAEAAAAGATREIIEEWDEATHGDAAREARMAQNAQRVICEKAEARAQQRKAKAREDDSLFARMAELERLEAETDMDEAADSHAEVRAVDSDDESDEGEVDERILAQRLAALDALGVEQVATEGKEARGAAAGGGMGGAAGNTVGGGGRLDVADAAPFPITSAADVEAFAEYKQLLEGDTAQPIKPPRVQPEPAQRAPATDPSGGVAPPKPSSPFDYSKWDHLEGMTSDSDSGDSDDESDTSSDNEGLLAAPAAQPPTPPAERRPMSMFKQQQRRRQERHDEQVRIPPRCAARTRPPACSRALTLTACELHTCTPALGAASPSSRRCRSWRRLAPHRWSSKSVCRVRAPALPRPWQTMMARAGSQ